MARGKKHTPQQVVNLLRQIEVATANGKSTALACKEGLITEQTYYRCARSSVGRPVENSYIESFNGKLRDECLNVEVFFNLADARRKLYVWRRDDNHQRPHSALNDRTPAGFAVTCAALTAKRLLSTFLLEALT